MLTKIIEKYEDVEFTKMDGFDKAIIGVCADTDRLVYSQKKIVKELMKQMSLEDALEYFYFNIVNNQRVVIVYDEF